METTKPEANVVVITPELAGQILEHADTIAKAATALGEAALALTAPKPAATIAPAAPAPVEPRVWDLSPEALENYDAEQLVDLRADHRGDNHSADGCPTCAVLVRRLGSV